MPFPLNRAVLPGLAVFALGACATEPPAMPGMAVLVKLVQPVVDPTAIATLVSEVTARPARYVSASSTSWHALAVACRGPADCELALQRLRADTVRFEAVQRDERKRIVSP
jgi:hypothetical protein